jgi:hypothetical protein
MPGLCFSGQVDPQDPNLHIRSSNKPVDAASARYPLSAFTPPHRQNFQPQRRGLKLKADSTLERRLLVEVNTRKLGENGKESKQKRPDIRSLNLRRRRTRTELDALRINAGESSIKSHISSAKEMTSEQFFIPPQSDRVFARQGLVGDVDIFSGMWR